MNFRRLLGFLCLLSTCFAQHTPRKCADVPIRTTDNKVLHISQYHGKVVVIAMMLTSCDECLQTMQFLSRLQTEYGARGLQVLAISLDESPVNVVSYAQRYRFPFPMAHLDKDGAIKLADLNATAHPTVPYIMFVDWQGNVRFQYPGNDPIWSQGDKAIREITTALLRQAAEKKGAQYQTKQAGK